MAETFEWHCRWGHVDPNGIAYYPRLVDAMHQAGEVFMTALDLAYWELDEKFGFFLPLVAMGMEFERPVVVGDTLTFDVEPVLGEKSLRLEITAYHEDGEVANHGYEQHVAVVEETWETVVIPDEMRDRLLRVGDD